MKSPITLLSIATILLSGCSVNSESLSSPDGELEVSFTLTSQGEPSYSAKYKDKPIVTPSLLGFEMKNGKNLTDGFHVDSISHSVITETWAPVWGENDSIVNNCRQMTVYLSRGSIKMDIEFRVFDDGFGFRYIFPEQAAKQFTITDEKTQIAMTGDHMAWWIPGDYDTQEYEYTRSRLSEIRSHAEDGFMNNVSQYRFSPTGVQTALMLKTVL